MTHSPRSNDLSPHSDDHSPHSDDHSPHSDDHSPRSDDLSLRFPSDIAVRVPDRFLLAGRVVARTGRTLALADAFAVVEIDCSCDLDPGDLVVLQVTGASGRPCSEEVVERHRPARRMAGQGGDVHRFLNRGVGRMLQVRSMLLDVVRSFFRQRGFVEADTPILVPSPGLDLHLDAVAADGGWLATSPEYQMKRLLVGGVPRVFQITHVFRKGEIGARHNPEFCMVEWYRAFAGVGEVMADTEQLVAEAAQATSDYQAKSNTFAPDLLSFPYERISVARAFARFAGVGENEALRLAEQDEAAFFRLLVEKVEPALARNGRPTFLVDYPISQASLARPSPRDPRVCERFELYAGGVELCNGFGELTDPVEQRRRFERDRQARGAQNRPVYPVDERFVGALEEGMPPSAGNALGFDRLVAICVGEPEIARVMPFDARSL
jgi:lysyl-tRNA synthetase class 2